MNSDSTNTSVIQILGTRPQFVKCIPELGKVINTGQHYDLKMIDVRDKFDYETKKHQDLYNYLLAENPSLVIVYGDTKSTLWGAEAAQKAGIPIAHIEAGIRDNSAKVENKIRKIVDHISVLNFAPTQLAYNNLINEGLKSTAHIVGDIMYDSYLNNRVHANYAIVTIHRKENANRETIDTWMNVATLFHRHVYVILHHRTRKLFAKWKNKAHLLEPMDYHSMLYRLKDAEKVYTDSGGLQKEAYWSGVPVVTIGGNPWPEIYAFGNGTAKTRIKQIIEGWLKGNET